MEIKIFLDNLYYCEDSRNYYHIIDYNYEEKFYFNEIFNLYNNYILINYNNLDKLKIEGFFIYFIKNIKNINYYNLHFIKND